VNEITKKNKNDQNGIIFIIIYCKRSVICLEERKSWECRKEIYRSVYEQKFPFEINGKRNVFDVVANFGLAYNARMKIAKSCSCAIAVYTAAVWQVIR
jgi:hypothetical protein